jgi:hypothetical protein
VVAGGDLDDHALDPARLDHLDLFRDAARERKDLGLEAEAGDVRDRRLVLLGDGRHSGLNPVDPHRVEPLRNRDLFSRRKTTAVCCSPSRSVTS